MIKPIFKDQNDVYILDQTLLPDKVHYQKCSQAKDLVKAIKELQVRGAPLIGIAAAFGITLAIKEFQGEPAEIKPYFYQQKDCFANTRPTAVNLCWALQRMEKVFLESINQGQESIVKIMEQEAENMLREDIEKNKTMGELGQELIQKPSSIMTICNAGTLATCGYGTALGVIRSAFKRNKIKKVWVTETRPVLQGARLTVWELMQDNIPVTLITDNMAAYVMKKGLVDCVIVGADRIAANGDTANKIGTYALALAAKAHNIPFFVAAPISTFDPGIATGDDIPIEERDCVEVRKIKGINITHPEVEVFNPAFDITPHEFIDAIICEKGIIIPPLQEGINAMLSRG